MLVRQAAARQAAARQAAARQAAPQAALAHRAVQMAARLVMPPAVQRAERWVVERTMAAMAVEVAVAAAQVAMQMAIQARAARGGLVLEEVPMLRSLG